MSEPNVTPSPFPRSTRPADETPEKGVAETIQDQLKSHVQRLVHEEGKDRFTKGANKGGGAPVAMTPLQRKYEKGDRQCVAAHDAGDYYFGWRSALGQRLQRELKKKKDVKKKYMAADDKEAWKRDWCQKQYKGALVRMRTYTTASSEEWLSKGKVVSFLRMCYEEGGPRGQWDDETIQDCAVIAQRCITMGYPFVQVDEQHGKVKYMWFEHQYSDKFQTRWEEIENQAEKKSGGGIALALTRGVTKPGKGAADPEGADGLEGDGDDDDDGGGGGGGGKPKPKPKPKSPATVALAHARKTITSIQSTLASAKSMAEDIADNGAADGKDDTADGQKNVEWAWAKTPAVQGKIDAGIKEIESIVKKNKLWQKLLIGTEVAQVGPPPDRFGPGVRATAWRRKGGSRGDEEWVV